jgi:hypothetical protein
MAYIVGIVSQEEKAELERRGWEIEVPPTELTSTVEDGDEVIQVWVDSSVFNVMNGPDWDGATCKDCGISTEEPPTKCHICEMAEMTRIRRMDPVFHYSCESNECVYLGHHNGEDLYFCPQERKMAQLPPALIFRNPEVSNGGQCWERYDWQKVITRTGIPQTSEKLAVAVRLAILEGLIRRCARCHGYCLPKEGRTLPGEWICLTCSEKDG